MYRIINAKTKETIENNPNPFWVKMQKNGIYIGCDNYEEADGITLSDEKTTLGIVGRSMESYTPLITVEEVSSDPYIFQQLESMQEQIRNMQVQSITTGEQVAEMYAVQTGDVVSKTELDAAYREGVNSYE